MGSADSANFIRSNPTNGKNTYTSTLFFGASVPNGAAAMGLQVAEGIVNLGISVITQKVFEGVALWNLGGLQRHSAIMAASQNPVNLGLTYDQLGSKIDNMATGQTKIIHNALDEISTKNLMKNPINRTWDGKGLNFLGAHRLEEISIANGKRASAFVGSSNPKVQQQLENLYGDLSRNNKLIVKPSALRNAVPIKSAALVRDAESVGRNLRGTISEAGERLTRAGIQKPISALESSVAPGVIKGLTRGPLSIYLKKVFGMVITAIAPAEALGTFCASLSATEAALASASVVSLGGTAVAAAALAPEVAACWSVYTLLHVFFISCYTWIPSVLGAVIDTSTAICPDGYPFNLYDSIVNENNKGGEIEWAILTGLPEAGAVISAFGPYVCWSEKLPPLPKLKETVHPPAYYFDPTLSLFTVEKVHASVFSTDGNNPGNVIVNGMLWTNPAYYEPALYRDPNGHFPIWVDFANTKMLDKMAQFYYENSRRNMYINQDGTATFEYISKFYGIISSSEFSCDVQCEISEITVDTLKGIKICERVTDPPEPGGSCTWHDRRFYWYVDITAGINLETAASNECGRCYTILQSLTTTGFPSNDPCAGFLGVTTMYSANGEPEPSAVTASQAACAKIYLMDNPPDNPRANWTPSVRMNDNMDKFFVTGCTYIDGTGTDAADVSNQLLEGTQIGDSVVALGTPGGTYYPPVVGDLRDPKYIPDIAARIDPPNSNVCKNIERAFTTYGSTTIPAAQKIINQPDPPAPIGLIGGPAPGSGSGSGSGSSPIIATNPAVLRATKTPAPWVFNYKRNSRGQPRLNSVAYNGTAKYLDMQWYGCVDPSPGEEGDSASCNIHSKWASILYQSVTMGAAMVTIPGLGGAFQAGALVFDSLSAVYVGVDSYLNCLTGVAEKQQGTFLLNGMIVTSQVTPANANFMMFQGPIMPFSPGYTPQINFSKNVPELSLRDCVNRYTLRYFVKTFQSVPTYSQYTLNKVLNISPRPVNETNNTPYCVFNFQYTNNSNSAQSTSALALKMALNGFGKDISRPYDNINTYLYQPTGVLNTVIPPAVPFKQNAIPIYSRSRISAAQVPGLIAAAEAAVPKGQVLSAAAADAIRASAVGTGAGPLYGPYNPRPAKGEAYYPPVPPSSQLFKPDPTCVGKLDCGNCALQARLFKQFNAQHLGVNISLETDTSGSTSNLCTNKIPQPAYGSGSGSSATQPGPYTAVLNSYTPNPILNQSNLQCVYNLNLDVFTPNQDPTKFNVYTQVDVGQNVLKVDPSVLGTSSTKQAVVTMFLNPIANPKRDELCLYDLAYDDYPSDLWYIPIPVSYFDVPPPAAPVNTNFSSQTNSPSCDIDCSGTALIQNLVTQFNTANTSKKINTVSRTYTPISSDNSPICDFDVEMVRTVGNVTVANNETVRFYLKPTSTPSCMFDLAGDDSGKSNSGLSLNDSTTIGMLPAPFVWSSYYYQTINKSLNNMLLNIVGLDGINVLNTVSKTALSASNNMLGAAIETQALQVCPSAKCNNPYVLQKIVNRFNFDNYPAYPNGQYASQKNSIVQIRKAGISSPTQCQLELVNSVVDYYDFLYKVENTTQPFLQQWMFDLIGDRTTECKFQVKDLSGTDIQKNVMSVSINPYALQQPSAQVFGLETLRVYNPVVGPASDDKLFSYNEPCVTCTDVNVLKAVERAYNNILVYPNGPANPKQNTLKHILLAFNPVPNVCEYKAQAIHSYYDQDYERYYTVPNSTAAFTPYDYTYIVATWRTGSDYDVETGKLLKNAPSVTEFHLPDFVMKEGKYYRANQPAPVILPYIANVVTDPSSVSYDITKPRFISPSEGKNTIYDF